MKQNRKKKTRCTEAGREERSTRDKCRAPRKEKTWTKPPKREEKRETSERESNLKKTKKTVQIVQNPELAQTTNKQWFVPELLRHQNLNRRPPAKTTQQQSYRVPQELLFRNTNPSSNQKKQKSRRRTKGQQRLTPLDKITPTTNNKIKKH